jgi:hypothetical protein
MADESQDNRDPASEGSGQAPSDGENMKPDRSSNRRRIIITSLLTPPAVMTLKARKAHAQSAGSTLGSDPPAKKLKHH